MEPERPEVYDRIPWETLERSTSDRHWIVYAIAGAVTLGALTYSFMRAQPSVVPPQVTVASTVPASTTMSNVGTTPPASVESPVVLAEADLYAVDPVQLAARAASHAEWFAVEYVAVDGTDRSREQLAKLLPAGIPVPEAPEGTQVFVDWAGAVSLTETDPGHFEVGVLVRSLVSRGEEGFQRQPALLVEASVAIDEDGLPRITSAPTLGSPTTAPQDQLLLAPVPEEISAQVGQTYESVVGGVERPEGGWAVVVMATGADGVSRPMTVTVP
jgi:hypothetical protein